MGRGWKGICRLLIEIFLLILRSCLFDVRTGLPGLVLCCIAPAIFYQLQVATFILSGWAAASWHRARKVWGESERVKLNGC